MRTCLLAVVTWLALSHGVGLATSPVVPPAMLSACKGQSGGMPCQFALSGKSVSGTCQPLPDGELACRPGGAPKPRAKPKPPQGAVR